MLLLLVLPLVGPLLLLFFRFQITNTSLGAGPPEEVGRAAERLETLHKETTNNLASVEVECDPKFHRHIIGKLFKWKLYRSLHHVD